MATDNGSGPARLPLWLNPPDPSSPPPAAKTRHAAPADPGIRRTKQVKNDDRSAASRRRSTRPCGTRGPGRRPAPPYRDARHQLDTLTRTQQDHANALEGIAELRDRVEQILAILDDDGQSSPAEWFWLTMADQKRGERLSELSDWVETVLRTQYPDYLTGQIKPCWPNHPEARWELAWLYQLWTLTYLNDRSTPKDAADWHDRWSPGVLRRLSQIMRRCEETCQR